MIMRMAVITMTGLAMACTAMGAEVRDRPGHGRPRMPDFGELDGNKDGRLTVDEFAAGPAEMIERRFGRIDRDGSGGISADELEQAREARRDFAAKQARPDAEEGKGPPRMPHFDELDTDADNSVSLAEFTDAQKAAMSRRFEAIDGNHDGFVSEEEFEKAREELKKRFGDRPGQPGPN